MVAQEVNSRHSPVSRKGSRALRAAGPRVGFPRFFSLLAFLWEHPTLLRLINSQQGKSDLKVTINREVSGLWLRENCLGSSFALQSQNLASLCHNQPGLTGCRALEFQQRVEISITFTFEVFKGRIK